MEPSHGGIAHVRRRRFIALLAVVAAAGAVAAWSRRSAVARWLLRPTVSGGAPGPLGEPTVATLRAAVLALLEDRVAPGAYLDYFHWRARHLPGYRALYEGFAAFVDREARSAAGTAFHVAPPEIRRRILRRMLPPRGWPLRLAALLDRERVRYGRLVLRDVFVRFGRTDAWVLSGYDAWPGEPRPIPPVAGWVGR